MSPWLVTRAHAPSQGTDVWLTQGALSLVAAPGEYARLLALFVVEYSSYAPPPPPPSPRFSLNCSRLPFHSRDIVISSHSSSSSGGTVRAPLSLGQHLESCNFPRVFPSAPFVRSFIHSSILFSNQSTQSLNQSVSPLLGFLRVLFCKANPIEDVRALELQQCVSVGTSNWCIHELSIVKC